MALRKKKNQQDDSEKLQALLQSWDIALPEKEKKPDFPEISENDFPKADFAENQPEIKISEPEEKFRKPEIQPELKKESEKKRTGRGNRTKIQKDFSGTPQTAKKREKNQTFHADNRQSGTG